MNQLPPTYRNRIRLLVGRMLCWTGLHDNRVISVTGSFGAGGSVEKRECRRCQEVTVRRKR